MQKREYVKYNFVSIMKTTDFLGKLIKRAFEENFSLCVALKIVKMSFLLYFILLTAIPFWAAIPIRQLYKGVSPARKNLH